MKILFVLSFFLSQPVFSSDALADFPQKDDSSSRTGKGQINYSWHGDQSKKPANCGHFKEFTSKLVLTPVSGRPVLFGDGNHARIEYYLTVDNKTKKIVDVVTSDMEHLFSENFPPTYDTFWGFKLVSSDSSKVLGSGHTGTGFYRSSGSLNVITNNEKITLGWRSGGDGFRIDHDGLKIYGEIYPTNSSAGYCLTKWSD